MTTVQLLLSALVMTSSWSVDSRCSDLINVRVSCGTLSKEYFLIMEKRVSHLAIRRDNQEILPRQRTTRDPNINQITAMKRNGQRARYQ
jgi:hypothetical protein